MPIIVWIFALAMLTTRWVHLQNSYAILRSRLYMLPVHFFHGCGTTPLCEAVFAGKEVCMSSLPRPPGEPICPKLLPPTLHIELDNCTKDNKCRYVFCFWSLLVTKRIFKEVFVSFLIVGYTYDDIDASFGQWRMKLHEEDFPTIHLLMKSYMDLDHMPLIPHMIEEVPNFKAFIKSYMLKGGDRLVGHTKAQQFRFYIRDDGLSAMQFKLLSHLLIGARMMVHSYGVKTIMRNVCSWMGIQSLANPTP